MYYSTSYQVSIKYAECCRRCMVVFIRGHTQSRLNYGSLILKFRIAKQHPVEASPVAFELNLWKGLCGTCSGSVKGSCKLGVRLKK